MSQMLDDDFPESAPDEEARSEDRPLPGAVLRATREAQGLSVSDVAQVIRFSVRQINALESDDYTGFPGATLLRGFIRSYAKFLKIDAVPLLAMLEPAMPMAADVRPPDNIGVADQLGGAPGKKPGLLIAGLLVLVVLAVALRFMPSSDGPAPATPALPAQMAMPPAAPAPAPVPASVPVPAAPVAATTPATPVAVVPGPVPAAPPVASPGTVSTPVPVAPVPAPPMAASGLRIELTDRSWIEVRDATQTVVMSGEFPAGTRQNVAGKPPFQVWIGKAAGVRVFMGERNIDLQPFTRAEVARLTVE